MSPRFFIEKNPVNNERILIGHCKDDKRVPFENIIKIREHLGLSDDNVMIFDDGGHSFNEKRDEVFERSINFLKNDSGLSRPGSSSSEINSALL